MSAVWQPVIRRIVKSVEAPEYDTRIFSAVRMPMPLIMVGIAALALASLYSIWWIHAMFSWFFVWFSLAVYNAILAGQYYIDVRRISGPNPSWNSDEALATRALAIAGDDSIAPLAQTQPIAPVDERQAAYGIRLSGLYRPARLIPMDGSRTGRVSVNAVLGVNTVLGVFLIGSTLLLQHIGFPFPWQPGVMASFMIVQGLDHFMRRLRLSRPFSVVANEHGLTWRRWGKRRTLPWSAAQALCMIELPPTGAESSRADGPTQRIYWIQGPDGAFTWASRPHAQWWRTRITRNRAAALPAAYAAYDEQAWNLCALAAWRTGLPLRDVTAVAADLAQLWPHVSLIRQALPPGRPLQITDSDQRRIANQRAIRHRRTRMLVGVEAALDIFLIAAAVTLLIGAPRVYGDQLRQAHRSAPIFADSLAFPSGQWPSATAPGAAFTYQDGVYVATHNTCCNLFALTMPTMSDGVIEVTLHQVSDYDLVTSGLVVRADQTAHRALVFSIAPNGGWRLQRFTLSADGSSGWAGDMLIYSAFQIPMGPIQRGPDVTNRLAVIVRGASYTFFVNGQYVGSYHDTQPTGDRVGVYSQGIGQTAAFSDFAVYPAPPAGLPFAA